MGVDTQKIRDAVGRIRELPTLPSVLGKVLTTAADPEASALDLGKLIAADQSLSATLLKLVNSAYYGFYRQIESVTHAIVMLGFFEVRNLTLTATAFRTLSRGSSSSYDRTQLWRHALATAMAAERCAKVLNVNSRGCFESGLLHDIGKVVLDTLHPEAFRDAARLAHEKGCCIGDMEKEVFGLDHAEVGGLLGEHWNLPRSVVEAIRCHHTPEQATVDSRLTAITAIANCVTYGAELGEWSSGAPPAFPEATAQAIGLSEADIQKVSRNLIESQDKINQFIGALSAGSRTGRQS